MSKQLLLHLYTCFKLSSILLKNSAFELLKLDADTSLCGINKWLNACYVAINVELIKLNKSKFSLKFYTNKNYTDRI